LLSRLLLHWFMLFRLSLNLNVLVRRSQLLLRMRIVAWLVLWFSFGMKVQRFIIYLPFLPLGSAWLLDSGLLMRVLVNVLIDI
jgi:hypothetical protein